MNNIIAGLVIAITVFFIAGTLLHANLTVTMIWTVTLGIIGTYSAEHISNKPVPARR